AGRALPLVADLSRACPELAMRGSQSLRLRRFALLKWRKQIDRNWKKSRGVMLAGNLAHGLQKAQLQRNRLLAHHRGGLHHFFRSLKFALGIDDFCASSALGSGLLAPPALLGAG